jgi:hypothetical protein
MDDQPRLLSIGNPAGALNEFYEAVKDMPATPTHDLFGATLMPAGVADESSPGDARRAKNRAERRRKKRKRNGHTR